LGTPNGGFNSSGFHSGVLQEAFLNRGLVLFEVTVQVFIAMSFITLTAMVYTIGWVIVKADLWLRANKIDEVRRGLGRALKRFRSWCGRKSTPTRQNRARRGPRVWMRMRAFRALAPVRCAPGQRDSARPDPSLRGPRPACSG